MVTPSKDRADMQTGSMRSIRGGRQNERRMTTSPQSGCPIGGQLIRLVQQTDVYRRRANAPRDND